MSLCIAFLAQLFWCGFEPDCCILLNFLHRCKTVTFYPSCGSLEEPHVARSKIRRTWWLGDGWDLVLHQNLLHCEAYVTRHIVVVQEPVFFPFFCPFYDKWCTSKSLKMCDTNSKIHWTLGTFSSLLGAPGLLLSSSSSDSFPLLISVPVVHRGFCNSCISLNCIESFKSFDCWLPYFTEELDVCIWHWVVVTVACDVLSCMVDWITLICLILFCPGPHMIQSVPLWTALMPHPTHFNRQLSWCTWTLETSWSSRVT